MICKYWWAAQDNEKKMHWVAWKDMCQRKKKGGLGYRDLHMFNLAMLARQGWRILMNPESLFSQVLKAKYFANGNLLQAVEKPGISYSWRSILCGVQALKDVLIWRVGDGTNIQIWSHPWIPNVITRHPSTPRGRTIISRVSELIDPTTGSWDRELVNDVFWEDDAKHILAIPIMPQMEDSVAWHFDPKGVFSVKSAYHVIEDREEREQKFQKGESSAPSGLDGILDWRKIWA
ncbi:hypothetical protein BS78_07G101900 [Paspalum vaginatum]|nr:hypothetical protein BS78_07G101900 [Paspalum vaginatum]